MSQQPTPYYADDHVTIYHGDCREILPGLERGDVLLTDPPYSQATHDNVRTWNDTAQATTNTSRVIDFAGITVADLRAVVELASVRRWAVFTCDVSMAAHLLIEPPSGFEFVRQCVWVKRRGAPQLTGDRPAMWWEPIVHLHPPGRKRWNGGGHHGNYFDDTDRETPHPTSKPLSMIRSMVERFSDPDELVVDPFMGSGTTLRAAKDLGRKAIGIELDERYCEIAANRMGQEVLDFGGVA